MSYDRIPTYKDCTVNIIRDNVKIGYVCLKNYDGSLKFIDKTKLVQSDNKNGLSTLDIFNQNSVLGYVFDITPTKVCVTLGPITHNNTVKHYRSYLDARNDIVKFGDMKDTIYIMPTQTQINLLQRNFTRLPLTVTKAWFEDYTQQEMFGDMLLPLHGYFDVEKRESEYLDIYTYDICALYPMMTIGCE